MQATFLIFLVGRTMIRSPNHIDAHRSDKVREGPTSQSARHGGQRLTSVGVHASLSRLLLLRVLLLNVHLLQHREAGGLSLPVRPDLPHQLSPLLLREVLQRRPVYLDHVRRWPHPVSGCLDGRVHCLRVYRYAAGRQGGRLWCGRGMWAVERELAGTKG